MPPPVYVDLFVNFLHCLFLTIHSMHLPRPAPLNGGIFGRTATHTTIGAHFFVIDRRCLRWPIETNYARQTCTQNQVNANGSMLEAFLHFAPFTFAIPKRRCFPSLHTPSIDRSIHSSTHPSLHAQPTPTHFTTHPPPPAAARGAWTSGGKRPPPSAAAGGRGPP